MFDRSILKSRAKVVLSNTYWYSFAVCLILYFLGGASNNSGGFFSLTYNYNRGNSTDSTNIFSLFSIKGYASGIITSFIIFISIFIIAVAVCFSVFLVNPLIVGRSSFFLGCRKGNKNIGQLFSAFKGRSYLKTVKTVFMKDLIVGLWSLLIIPGIYFGYAYCFVPYICAENPGIDANKARELSKRITEGSKFDIFVFNLSFIGWYLLGGLVIIGTLFVNPYYEASFSELYVELRDSAVRKGVVSYEELMS